MSQKKTNYDRFMSDLYDRIHKIELDKEVLELEKRMEERKKHPLTEEDRDFFLGYIYDSNKEIYGYKMSTAHLNDLPLEDLRDEANDYERRIIENIAHDKAMKTVKGAEMQAVRNNPTASIIVDEDDYYYEPTKTVIYKNMDDVENFRLILVEAEEAMGQKLNIDLDGYKPDVEIKSAMQLAFENASNKNRSRSRPRR